MSTPSVKKAGKRLSQFKPLAQQSKKAEGYILNCESTVDFEELLTLAPPRIPMDLASEELVPTNKTTEINSQFSCEICHIDFDTESSFDLHLQQHEKKVVSSLGDKKYTLHT